MRFTQFYTLKEQEALRVKGEYDEESHFWEIITVTEAQKARLEKIRQKINDVEKKARSSKNESENKAADLLSSVTSAMHDARKIQPECPPSRAMGILREQPFPTCLGSSGLSRCLDVCAEAIVSGDYGLFRALAKILALPKFGGGSLGEAVSLGNGFDPLIKHAHDAFIKLQQEGTLIPNKKQVAERAIYRCARATVLARPEYCDSPYKWKERDDSEFPDGLCKAIREEAKRLKKRLEQKESRFWTNAGLKDLPRADKKPKKRGSKGHDNLGDKFA